MELIRIWSSRTSLRMNSSISTELESGMLKDLTVPSLIDISFYVSIWQWFMDKHRQLKINLRIAFLRVKIRGNSKYKIFVSFWEQHKKCPFVCWQCSNRWITWLLPYSLDMVSSFLEKEKFRFNLNWKASIKLWSSWYHKITCFSTQTN